MFVVVDQTGASHLSLFSLRFPDRKSTDSLLGTNLEASPRGPIPPYYFWPVVPAMFGFLGKRPRETEEWGNACEEKYPETKVSG